MTHRSALIAAGSLIVPLVVSLAAASSPEPLALTAETVQIDRAEADALVRQLRAAVRAGATKSRLAGAPVRLAMQHQPAVAAPTTPTADDIDKPGTATAATDDAKLAGEQRTRTPRIVRRRVRTKAPGRATKGADLSRALIDDAARLSRRAGRQVGPDRGKAKGKAGDHATDPRAGRQAKVSAKGRLHALPGKGGAKGQGKRRDGVGGGPGHQGSGPGQGTAGGVGPRGTGMGGTTGGMGSGTPKRR